MRGWFCLATVVASAVLLSAQARVTKTLDIYVVDGTFTVTNPRTGFSKVYRGR